MFKIGQKGGNIKARVGLRGDGDIGNGGKMGTKKIKTEILITKEDGYQNVFNDLHNLNS